eukprot:SAG11_NODE_2298_length_3552_cov_11.614538_2_plen_144_part_00
MTCAAFCKGAVKKMQALYGEKYENLQQIMDENTPARTFEAWRQSHTANFRCTRHFLIFPVLQVESLLLQLAVGRLRPPSPVPARHFGTPGLPLGSQIFAYLPSWHGADESQPKAPTTLRPHWHCLTSAAHRPPARHLVWDGCG